MADSSGAKNKSVALADGRWARLARDAEGEPLGVAVFLADDDLQQLGIDLAHADWVAYAVVDGDLALYGEASTSSESR